MNGDCFDCFRLCRQIGDEDSSALTREDAQNDFQPSCDFA